MSDGGFSNWNWGHFGRAVGMGAVSGIVTGGIGNAFGPVGSGGIGGEIGRALAHGQANMMIGAAFGQEPSLAGFATGALSSLGGSAFMMYGGKFANSTAGLYAISGTIGGITAGLSGGDFWRGASVGLMTAGLNHIRTSIEEASKARYFANKKAFYDYLWKNSFDKDGNPIREVSGWELKNGNAIALPYDKNTIGRSYNKALPVGKVRGRLALEFQGKNTI